MVELEQLGEQDLATLREMISNHQQRTGSAKAAAVLADWNSYQAKFVKVMPRDYKRMLEAIARAEAAGLSGEAALIAAFEENSGDEQH
jgi:glutamate synthase (NADH) large subunit (EC 1.4.1.14)